MNGILERELLILAVCCHCLLYDALILLMPAFAGISELMYAKSFTVLNHLVPMSSHNCPTETKVVLCKLGKILPFCASKVKFGDKGSIEVFVECNLVLSGKVTVGPLLGWILRTKSSSVSLTKWPLAPLSITASIVFGV